MYIPSLKQVIGIEQPRPFISQTWLPFPSQPLSGNAHYIPFILTWLRQNTQIVSPFISDAKLTFSSNSSKHSGLYTFHKL